MKTLKCACSICAQNLRKWKSDYRVWCVGILLLIMTSIYVDDLRKIVDYWNAPMPVWIYPFMYSQYHTKLIFTLPVVLLFCNAPFTDRNQTFVLMRSGRTKWLCGQVLYIIVASGIYYLFIIACSLIITLLSGGQFTMGWDKTLTAIAYAAGSDTLELAPFVYVDNYVLTFFTPLLAMWFTFLMSWLGAIFLGVLTFALNLISQTRAVGVFASSFFVLFSSAVYKDGGRHNRRRQTDAVPAVHILYKRFRNSDSRAHSVGVHIRQEKSS